MMVSRRRWTPVSLGALALLLTGLMLVGCGSAKTTNHGQPAGHVTPTSTCLANPGQSMQQAAGRVKSVSKDQLTIQATTGPVIVELTATTQVIRQQTAARSDLQEGQQAQVVVQSSADGSYSAQQVLISALSQTGTSTGIGTQQGCGSGSGGPELPSGTPGGGFPGGAPGTGGGPGSGSSDAGGIFGNLPPGEKGLVGTVASINGHFLIITTQDGNDYTITLEETTTYSRLVAVQASDIQVGQAVLAAGQQSGHNHIKAQFVTLVLALPSGQ